MLGSSIRKAIFHAPEICKVAGLGPGRSSRKLLKTSCPCRRENGSRHFCRTLALQAAAPARLTPQEVNNILRENEVTKEFAAGETAVRSYDTNQLSANNPMEDTKNEGLFLPTNGHLFGVFDGHAGGACAQVLSKRLFQYIAANLGNPKNSSTTSSKPLIEASIRKQVTVTKLSCSVYNHPNVYDDGAEFVDVLRELYNRSHEEYHAQKRKSGEETSPAEALRNACVDLDADITREALQSCDNHRLRIKTLSVAMSGAVAVAAYVEGSRVHVATVGDCQAVLGQLKHDEWRPKLLSELHTADNNDEVERILNEHPANERDSIIKFDRLFGQLMPLRAFGDVRYKWEAALLKQLIVPHFGPSVVSPGYLTPPYLTALPHVVSHKLSPKDKFLILATDGLWDFITPQQAVRLVGEHMRGRTVLTPFTLARPDMTLGHINEALLVRRDCLSMRPADSNGSTHLMRSALSATEYGLDNTRLAQLLALPPDVARNFRDDMTVTVVYFDDDFLRQSMIDTNA